MGWRGTWTSTPQMMRWCQTDAPLQPVGKTNQHINLREVSARLQLCPGTYAIVPATFRPGEEGQFLVCAFVERSWGASGQAAGHSVQEGASGDGGARHDVSSNVNNIPILRVGDNPEDGEGGKGAERDQILDFGIRQIGKRCLKAASFPATCSLATQSFNTFICIYPDRPSRYSNENFIEHI